MIEKMRRLSWTTYSSILLIVANILIIFTASQIVLNTKEMSNNKIMISYIILGLVAAGLIKLSNAAASNSPSN